MEKDRLEATLATVHALLRAEGQYEAAHLVQAYPARAEQTGYDNWNGGTEIWEIIFQLPPAEFARLATRRKQLEDRITARLKTVLETETHDWYSAKIAPARELRKDWRADSSGVPKQVRVNMLDAFKLEGEPWHGRLDEIEFLSRLYDLRDLPSYDKRFKDAAGDIWQHRYNNNDWDCDWVFTDDRFGLLDGPPDQFLRFVCETVHPVVRPDRNTALRNV